MAEDDFEAGRPWAWTDEDERREMMRSVEYLEAEWKRDELRNECSWGAK